MSKQRYLTKFARLTLNIGVEPEEYLKDKLSLDWSVRKIFMDLHSLSRKYECDMVDRRTLTNWIKKVQGEEISAS